MEVEVIPEEPKPEGKPNRRRGRVVLEKEYLSENDTVLTGEIEDVVEEIVKEIVKEVQEVDYGEQDVRTPASSNGWASHLVEPTVGDDEPPPPELPEEPEYHSHGKGDKPSTALRLTMAGLYLSFGGLLVYAGAVVLHDLWKERDK